MADSDLSERLATWRSPTSSSDSPIISNCWASLTSFQPALGALLMIVAAQAAFKDRFLELKQFLVFLPRDIQAWVRAYHPGSTEKAVTLVQHLE